MGTRAVVVVPQRAAHHRRPQVGAADADVDDVGDGLAGEAAPRPGADGIGERAHRGEDLVDLRDHLHVVDDELGRGGRRRAVCRTERSSEVLMRAPASMASRCSSTPVSRASDSNSSRVSRVTRFFE